MSETSTKFFEFDQNNSGGSFDVDDATGIGPRVWIEAIDLPHALSRAASIGIYFNGCEDGRDCSCCGDRWSEPWDADGKAEPEINTEYDFTWHSVVYVHLIDGSIVRIRQSDVAA